MITPIWLPALILAAALICSLVGRVLLVGAAFNISTLWGLTVLFVPFGPTFFRLKYAELAMPTRYWRMAVGPLMLLFFVSGGSADSFRSLSDLGKPTAQSGSLIGSLFGKKDAAPPAAAEAPAPAPAAVAQATPPPAAAPAVAKAAAKVTPSPAVAAAAAQMAPAPKIQDIGDRLAANQHEFERLAEVYDQLKHERGYLRKHDEESIAAYNDAVAKYQAAVQAAKNEQAAISKLSAKK